MKCDNYKTYPFCDIILMSTFESFLSTNVSAKRSLTRMLQTVLPSCISLNSCSPLFDPDMTSVLKSSNIFPFPVAFFWSRYTDVTVTDVKLKRCLGLSCKLGTFRGKWSSLMFCKFTTYLTLMLWISVVIVLNLWNLMWSKYFGTVLLWFNFDKFLLRKKRAEDSLDFRRHRNLN